MFHAKKWKGYTILEAIPPGIKLESTAKRFLESWKLWKRKLAFASTAYEVVTL
jgi:hypothetical protein